jgi:hypothetical protein
MDPVIQLDRARTLRYSSRAMRLVEERSGHALGELLVTRVGVSAAVHLLWGALIDDDTAFQRRREPELTVDDVCEFLDEHWFPKYSLKDLWPLFMSAAEASGFFSRGVAGKAAPETVAGSPVSGVNDSSTTDSVGGSSV